MMNLRNAILALAAIVLLSSAPLASAQAHDWNDDEGYRTNRHENDGWRHDGWNRDHDGLGRDDEWRHRRWERERWRRWHARYVPPVYSYGYYEEPSPAYYEEPPVVYYGW